MRNLDRRTAARSSAAALQARRQGRFDVSADGERFWIGVTASQERGTDLPSSRSWAAQPSKRGVSHAAIIGVSVPQRLGGVRDGQGRLPGTLLDPPPG